MDGQQLTSHPTKEMAAVKQKMSHPISPLKQRNQAVQKPWQRIWFHKYCWYTCKQKATQSDDKGSNELPSHFWKFTCLA